MAKNQSTFEGLPYEVFAALAPLVDKEKGNQRDLIKRFLDAWDRSPEARFAADTQKELDAMVVDRDLAEARIIAFAKLWVAMQTPDDGQHR